MMDAQPVGTIPEMKYFTSNDNQSLAYQDIGDASKPPLILLHGFTGTSVCFTKKLPASIQQDWRVIAPDLRGHGASAKPTYGYHVSRLAMDLQTLLSHLNYNTESSVNVVAGSLGCAILWSYAELFTPQVFRSMVWVDQAPMQNYALDGSWGPEMGNRGMNCEDAVRQLFKDFCEDPDRVYLSTIAACLSYRSYPLPSDIVSNEQREEDEIFFLEQARRGNPKWYAQLMKDHTAKDWRDVLRSCFQAKKIMVVASSRSGCFPAKGMLEAAKMVNEGGGEAKGVEVEWGGHWCYWEQPERFWGLVREFL
ncbi:alpha/beta-hydrolase, partial [Periconia macrospinosa]